MWRRTLPEMTANPDEMATAALVEASELEGLEDAVDGLPMWIDPLRAAPGKVRMSMLTLPGISISTGLTELPIRSSGEVAKGAIVVGVPLSAAVGYRSSSNRSVILEGGSSAPASRPGWPAFDR